MTTTPGLATAAKTLRIGHSPDPDDAFMWWPLANFTAPDGTPLTPRIDTRGYDFVHVLEDIQSLNERSERGELEITAFSIHQYPFVADKYALTSCGSSMGDGYGPMVVTRADHPLHAAAEQSEAAGIRALKNIKLAMPGPRTTAWLALQLLLAEHGLTLDDLRWEHVAFDDILNRVESGDFDAGLIIHEGQITFADQGLALVVDLGKWWTDTRGLPLPLGGNAIRRDLVASGEAPVICRVLLDSIEHALEHRDEAVKFALNYARNMGADLADRFVGMYVNRWTMDYGDRGRAAVQQLLTEGAAAGLIPGLPGNGTVDFIEPG